MIAVRRLPIKGDDVRSELVEFGDSLGIPVKYCALVDYSNSRGAMDMGLLPDLLPGYQAPANPAGMMRPKCWRDRSGRAVGGGRESAERCARRLARRRFVVVQDMFLTETAQRADVVLPAARPTKRTAP